jgi:hypothetical protein
MFTWSGDANLDGKINVDDYGRIDVNVNLGTNGYANADFNYDGKINIDDYGIIDSNIGIQGAPISTSVFSQAVATTGSREAGGVHVARPADDLKPNDAWSVLALDVDTTPI